MKVRFLHPAIGAFAVRIPDGKEMVVGRGGHDADIEISWDPQISRRHAKIWVERDHLFIEDLGSRNGCWHGQQRLHGTVRLDRGSSVLVGETALLIPDEATQAPAMDPAETFEAPSPLSHTWAIADAATQPHTELAEIDLFSRDLNVDLPEPEPVTPVVVGQPGARRALPYFVTPSRVAVRSDRSELARLWLEELSKGGLFVGTDAPPPVGSRVQVRFDLEGSPLDLGAEVVAVVPSPPGVGLALPELLGMKGATLNAFIEGRTADVPGANAPDEPTAPSETLDEALERAAQVLLLTEQDSLYAALGVAPDSEMASISHRAEALVAQLQASLPGAQPPQAARLNAAIGASQRAARILSRPNSRLDYDFRAGHVRAHERINAARNGTGPSVADLRRAWNHVHAADIELAARITREAFQARQEHNLERAIQYGERALQMNPFFEELEKTVVVWKGLLQG